MKKLGKILLSILLVLGLTGCIKVNVNMGVTKDKKVNFEAIYAIDVTSINSMGGSISDSEETDVELETEEENNVTVKAENYNFLQDKGYKVEEFTETKDDSTLNGVKITKTFDNIDDITSKEDIVVDITKLLNAENAENFDDSVFFSGKNGIYKANYVFDFATEGDTTDYTDYQSMFDLKYTITLPEKAGENNATSVSEDGKTLTWNLLYGKKNEVNFTFKLASQSNPISAVVDNNILTYAIIGLGVVVVAVIAIVLVSKKKKAKKTESVSNTEV